MSQRTLPNAAAVIFHSLTQRSHVRRATRGEHHGEQGLTLLLHSDTHTTYKYTLKQTLGASLVNRADM